MSKNTIRGNRMRTFLRSLSDLEFRYLRLVINMASEARDTIFKFSIEKEEFCQKMGISLDEYDNYLKGGIDFNMMHMASLQALYMEKASEKNRREARQLAHIVVNDQEEQQIKRDVQPED